MKTSRLLIVMIKRLALNISIKMEKYTSTILDWPNDSKFNSTWKQDGSY